MPAGGVDPGALGSVSGAFFAKLNPAGQIAYAGVVTAPQRLCEGGSSCFLSAVGTSGNAISVDPAGNAYIAGNTNGGALPTTAGVLQAQGTGAFIVQVMADGFAQLAGRTGRPN